MAPTNPNTGTRVKVLLAIDASPTSLDVLDIGQDLLGEDDQIIVLNVATNDPPALSPIGLLVQDPHEPTGDPDRTITDRRENAQLTADTAAELLDADTALVLEGNPGQRIVDAAVEYNVDLIIVGTGEKGAIARFFQGSVSRFVLDNAPCSVLIAR